MAADHFCLRWNNHQSTLVSVFDDLLESETLVDCTLAADGKYLKAHKVVLSACSPYLGMILSQHYDQHPIIILKDVKYEEMKAMLDYMYRGEVNISQEHLATFLKAAESLQIKGLTDTSSLNEEANKKQLQVERAPSSDESTTSAPTVDEAPSREGSCSPTPKKRKHEVLTQKNIESDDINEIHTVLTDTVSDLSVHNNVSTKFKRVSSDITKNSVCVKSEPVDEPLNDDVTIPSIVRGSEGGKKGIPRPGPSNGSNSSIVGSPWLMSVDSIGDERHGSEQDRSSSNKCFQANGFLPMKSDIWMSKVCETNNKILPHQNLFVCKDCGKSYQWKQGLNTHKRLHCGKDPKYQCPYCPKRCYQRGNLESHIRNVHLTSSIVSKIASI